MSSEPTVTKRFEISQVAFLRVPDHVNERNLLDYNLGIFDFSDLYGIFLSYKTLESVLLTFLTCFESSPSLSPLAEFSH